MQLMQLHPFSEIVLRNTRLIDGTGSPPRANVDIQIAGGTIRHVWPSRGPGPVPGPPGDSLSQGVVELDCRDLTILPGLVDCHVHLALDGLDFQASLDRWDHGEALSRHLSEALRNTLLSGVLAVRDGGDRRLIGLRAGCLSGEAAAPPFLCATGGALRKKGRYGSFLGKGLAPQDIGPAVEEMAAAGAAQIKVLVSGIVSFQEYKKVGPLQFSREELSQLVARAHDRGLRVMAHASSGEGAALAVQCGVDSLEHGYFVSRDTLERMAERGTTWVPTLLPVAIQARAPLRAQHSPPQRAVIERTYLRQQRMVEIAHGLGVTIGVGTDAGASGVRHGLSYVEELKLLAGAGLRPEGALQAATANGARILGLEDKLGRAVPGMPAYLIGVRGDPLLDMDCLQVPERIFVP